MRSTIVPAFEKEHPGVKVRARHRSVQRTGVAKLKAAGKDNPPYDVVTTNEVWAAPFARGGTLHEAAARARAKPQGRGAEPQDQRRHGGAGAGWPHRPRVSRRQDQNGAEGVEGPVDRARVQGAKIGIYNIVNSAGQMTICLTSKIWTGGDKDIDAAYKKIAELKPFKQTDFSGDMEKLLVQGEVLIGILDMPAAVRLQKSGAPIGWVAPAEGMLMFEQDVAVTAGSKNKPAAFAYVNWMLKRETQETWLRQFYWLPANTRVKMPDELKPIMPVTQADIPKILQWDWLWINDQKPEADRPLEPRDVDLTRPRPDVGHRPDRPDEALR